MDSASSMVVRVESLYRWGGVGWGVICVCNIIHKDTNMLLAWLLQPFLYLIFDLEIISIFIYICALYKCISSMFSKNCDKLLILVKLLATPNMILKCRFALLV